MLCGQTAVSRIGADPLITNAIGRNVLYIAVEAGLDDVVRCIFKHNPTLKINTSSTSEIQNYYPIHVAAR